MIFDKLCKVVERILPKYRKYVEESRLFRFDGIPHKFLPENISDEIYNGFFLPFPTTAIEDKASVVILHDSVPNDQGWDNYRLFIECLLSSSDEDAFSDSMEMSYKKEMSNTCIINIGKIKLTNTTPLIKNRMIEGSLSEIYNINYKDWTFKKLIGTELYKFSKDILIKTLRNPATALEEVMYLNTPKRFVVENQPLKQKRKTKKILRSHDRSIYTLLKPIDIKNLFAEKSGGSTNLTVTGHERRRHNRTFQSDRFVKAKGKTINIPATWVGPKEVKTTNRKYKVRLDL